MTEKTEGPDRLYLSQGVLKTARFKRDNGITGELVVRLFDEPFSEDDIEYRPALPPHLRDELAGYAEKPNWRDDGMVSVPRKLLRDILEATAPIASSRPKGD